jgi:AcrR family transcriptional regulator
VQLTADDGDDVSASAAARGDAMGGRLAARKRATEIALRRAALQLVGERGYAATSTDDIARAAGVSPRTFFNYFPTKESVILLPEGLLSDLVVAALERRPATEDPVASLAAAAMATFDSLSLLADSQDALLIIGLRVMLTEPPLRRIMLERRAATEDAAWATLQQRGVSPNDLGVRIAVAAVLTLGDLAIERWAESGGIEPLKAVLARCLLLAPDPARLAVGVTASSR